MPEIDVSASISVVPRMRVMLNYAPPPSAVRSTVFVCDIVGATSTLRVPVSSVQTTTQFDRQNFISVVVPAAEQYADAIAALLAEVPPARIVVRMARRLLDGTTYMTALADCPLGQARIDRGGNRLTASLSGYDDETVAAVELPQSRTARGVQTVTTGQGGARCRAQIDDLLAPGMLVDAGGTVFRAAYINVFVSGSQAYMDTGARE